MEWDLVPSNFGPRHQIYLERCCEGLYRIVPWLRYCTDVNFNMRYDTLGALTNLSHKYPTKSTKLET